MPEVVLTEKLLAGLAGWEVVKQARAIVAENRVLSSNWQAPVLRGVVQSGSTSYRAGLVIRRENDAENLCTCRSSREWGTLCAHSVAIGIHALRPSPVESPPPAQAAAPPGAGTPSGRRPPSGRRLRRAGEGERGEALEICIVLPLNLAESLSRGRATVFLEGKWRRGRSPLQALPIDQVFAVDAADARLLDVLEEIADGDTPAMLQVRPEDFATVLQAMTGHPRISFGRTREVRVSAEPWRVPLRASLSSTGEITLLLRPLAALPAFIPAPRPWILAGDEFQPLGLPAECLPVLNAPMHWNRPQVPVFLNRILPELQRVADLESEFEASDFVLEPKPPEFHLHLAGGLASLAASLQCVYGHRVLTLGVAQEDESLWMADPSDPHRYSTRDIGAERDALAVLQQTGFTGPDAQGRFHLAGQNPVLTFFSRVYPRLERKWKVTLEERLERSTERHLERVEPRFTITPSGEQWFDLQVTFEGASGEGIPATEIQRLLLGGQGQTRLRNGKLALIDTGAVEELEEILVDCSPQQHGGVYRMDRTQSGFLNATLEDQGWKPVAPAAWQERARDLAGRISLDCPPLGALDAVLRPYQKHGVAWFGFLRRNGFGGILADEMGLGKTVQALAHLASLRRTGHPEGARSPSARGAAESPGINRPAEAPHLVICPTSLVPNWVAEAARFTPELRVLAIHGPSRHGLFDRMPACDVVVTSYALVRRDLERYRALEFDTVVLDEAQHIKNRETRNAQAVKAIRSRHRLVLTGTPLENSVLDLWSVFDFLMPGYLGPAKDFQDRYEVPIVRERNEAVQARLARRVRPFLLRRLKREVAPELPPRIDQVVWCELSEEQSAAYRQLLDATRREVVEAVSARGLARSRMLVLTALLRLRQVCCDLRLLGLDDEKTSPDPESGRESTTLEAAAQPTTGIPLSAGAAGGKVDAFAELLEEVLDGGHRVLVFSQFTRMLGLLKEQLASEGIRYAYLDGSTRDRGGVVASFQQTDDIPVFLISLKAGGVGLNLTGADTVIHFDPWWNPAVEDQATDRAHRIGQSRVVTSYKLITRGTVEEKILGLQQRKREVLQGILQGEEMLTQALSWEEINELLS